MAIEKELLDQLLAGREPKDVFNKDGLVDELKKALSERILNTELDEHLDGEAVDGKGNRRNGYSKKSVLTGTSKMTLSVPRDRAGTFDPKLIAKYQRRFPDFDDKIISMYARGMTVREIRGHLEELYGIEVSPDLISAVTDAVLDEVAEWQNRALDLCYPLVFFDAIRVKVRDEGFVRNKAIYIALGVLPDGTKEIPASGRAGSNHRHCDFQSSPGSASDCFTGPPRGSCCRIGMFLLKVMSPAHFRTDIFCRRRSDRPDQERVRKMPAESCLQPVYWMHDPVSCYGYETFGQNETSWATDS